MQKSFFLLINDIDLSSVKTEEDQIKFNERLSKFTGAKLKLPTYFDQNNAEYCEGNFCGFRPEHDNQLIDFLITELGLDLGEVLVGIPDSAECALSIAVNIGNDSIIWLYCEYSDF